jgi:hypothetical protein
MSIKRGCLLTALVLAPCRISAQSQEICVPYDARYEQAPLMQVKANAANPKVYFQRTAEPCPAEPQACPSRQKAYLVPGDVVFAASEVNGFRCAYYGTAKGDIAAGFLPADVLEPANDDSTLDVSFLSGTWTKLRTNPITFTAAGTNAVQAKGTAQWHGPAGVVHYGSFSSRAQLQGNAAEFQDLNCVVKIRRRGPYLLVSDNSRCGGMNVHFQGIYVKRTK